MGDISIARTQNEQNRHIRCVSATNYGSSTIAILRAEYIFSGSKNNSQEGTRIPVTH